MALSEEDKIKVAWYYQEKLTRGWDTGGRGRTVVGVYQMSSWDEPEAGFQATPRTYIRYDDGSTLLADPAMVKRCQQALFIVPEDFVLGEGPEFTREFICMWCGSGFDTQDECDEHEGECSG